MVLTSFFIPALLALPGLATQHSNNPLRHRGVARNLELQKKDVAGNTSNLFKRSFSGRMTYYQTGMGACGQWNNPSDFIVALNSAQYGSGYPGPYCGHSITISYNGKTQQAQITDECPTCSYGELDLSQSLFESFASTDMGIFNAEWWFNDGSGGGGDQSTSTSQTQEPTSQPPPPPPETTTSTWTPPPETTSTHQEPTSTSSTSSETTTSTTSTSTSSTSTTASSETSTSSSSTSASASSTLASSTENAKPTGAVVNFAQALGNLGALASAGCTIKP